MQPTTEQRIQAAVRILEDAHFTFPTTAELAASVGLSSFYFTRQFKKHTGRTVGEYLQGVRLRQAAFRLRIDDDPIQAMHADYGYESHAAFTRAFTKFHGVSPSAYRLSVKRADATADADAPVQVSFRGGRFCWVKRYVGGFARHQEHWARFRALLPVEAWSAGAAIGLLHDDPRATPPDQLRYDCCLALPAADFQAPAADLAAQGVVAYLTTEGLYAGIRYRGGYDTVNAGYRGLVAGWMRSQSRYRMAGEPIMEAFHPGSSPEADPVDLTIALKVRRIDDGPDWEAGRDQRQARLPEILGDDPG